MGRVRRERRCHFSSFLFRDIVVVPHGICGRHPLALLHVAAVRRVVHQVQIEQLAHGEVGHATHEAQAELGEGQVLEVLSTA